MKRIILIAAIAVCSLFAETKAQTVVQTQVSPITDALKIMNTLQPVTFKYEADVAEKLGLKTSVHRGLNMQELLKTQPNLVINQQLHYTAGKNNNKSATVPVVDQEALIALLVSSIKEQQQQIDALKSELNKLKEKNAK